MPFKDLAERTLGKGEHVGFEWEIVKANGHRCGYVRVLPGHPWFGKSYSCRADEHWEDKPHECTEFSADVHGGITFADFGKECPTHGKADEWWVGFDCAHYMDADDPELMDDEMKQHRARWPRDGIVRSQDYVIDECRSLCEQAHHAALATVG